MQQWQKNLYLLWLSMLVASMCWSSVSPFIPVFLRDELGVEAASAWAGSIVAMGSVLGALSAPLWGALGDRFGRKPMILRAGIALTISYLILSQSQSVYHVLAARLVQGLLSGFIPTAIVLISTSTPQESVGRALALGQTGPQAGSILGPLLGGILADLFGLRRAMLTAAGLIGSATLFVLLMVREDFTPPAAKRRNILGDLKASLTHPVLPFLMMTTVFVNAALSSLEPVMVPYIKSLVGPGAPLWVAGALYSLPGIFFIAAAPWWARLGERRGFITTLATGSVIAGLMALPQAFAVTAWEFGLLRGGQGLAASAIQPGVSALIATTVALADRGRAFGLNQSANAVGYMVGPLLGGFLGTLMGPRWVLAVAGLLLLTNAYWVKRILAPRLQAHRAAKAG